MHRKLGATAIMIKGKEKWKRRGKNHLFVSCDKAISNNYQYRIINTEI